MFGMELPTKMSIYRCYNLFSEAGYISKGETSGKQQFLKLSCMKFKWPLFAVQKINKTSGLKIQHGGFNSTENCDTFEIKTYKY